MKKTKNELKKDSVTSDTIHVGIELELCAPGGDHDDDACYDSRLGSQREYLESLSTIDILRNYFDLSRDEATQFESYFKVARWTDDYMSEHVPEPCEGDCGFGSGDGEGGRDSIEDSLRDLTGNKSIKVVSDGSIRLDSGEFDAEVCWNYFISKETIQDNAKILGWCDDQGMTFNTSCGLHINLNNYLKIDQSIELSTKTLAPLFDFVAGSRSGNSYCNRYGMSGDEKYSMIYSQGDRLEFRFFSPTLDAEKLNHYVTLAHTVYKRLAGKQCKLPAKTASYFKDKIVKVNKRTIEEANAAIEFVNSLQSAFVLSVAEQVQPTLEPVSSLEQFLTEDRSA